MAADTIYSKTSTALASRNTHAGIIDVSSRSLIEPGGTFVYAKAPIPVTRHINVIIDFIFLGRTSAFTLAHLWRVVVERLCS